MLLEIRLFIIRFKYFFTDSIPFFVARKLPRKVVYYAIIRAWAYSTVNTYPNKTPDECTWDMVLKDSDKF